MDLKVRYTSPTADREFTRSIRDTGFAVLADHPVDANLIRGTYDEWSRFFASDDKHRFAYDPETYWGYYPFASENAKDTEVKDLKEFFHVYAWSPLPEAMGGATRRLFETLTELAGVLLGWIEANTPDDVRERFSMPLTAMIQESQRTVFRILHYPPVQGAAEPGAVRAREHEDINLLTLLPASTAPGLQVRDASGEWHDVATDPANIVVNSGDMLQEVSGGDYRSTTHRVVNPTASVPNVSRLSMPLFLHPRPEVQLSERYSAREYLDERLTEIGLRPAGASPSV